MQIQSVPLLEAHIVDCLGAALHVPSLYCVIESKSRKGFPKAHRWLAGAEIHQHLSGRISQTSLAEDRATQRSDGLHRSDRFRHVIAIVVMASNLLAMASNPGAMASNLVAMERWPPT